MGNENWAELIKGADPANGSAFTRKVTGRAYEAVLIAKWVLTTSAVVANRVPIVTFQDGDGGEFARFTSGITVAANNIISVTFAAGYAGTPAATATFVTAPLPYVTLPPGYTIGLDASALDVGDIINNVRLWLRRLPTGESGEPSGAVPYQPPEVLVMSP